MILKQRCIKNIEWQKIKKIKWLISNQGLDILWFLHYMFEMSTKIVLAQLFFFLGMLHHLQLECLAPILIYVPWLGTKWEV